MKVVATVKVGSSKEEFLETVTDGLELREATVWTHARAHDGEANKKVIELTAEFYHVPKTRVKILRGLKSRVKTLEVNLT